jgi:hypothetical protein
MRGLEANEVRYEDLVNGVRMLEQGELPEGAECGFDVARTFVINTQVYLPW